MKIAGWLASIGLERYAKAFEDNDVDTDLVATLSDADLVSIGVTSLGHRRRLLAAASGGEVSRAPEASVRSVPIAPATPSVGAAMTSALEQRGYRIVDRLGQGGMGEVFRARQVGVDRDVAVKVLRAREGDAERARFAREARAIAALRHPNTVRLFDYLLADDGSACIVMEYVQGESLWARLSRERRLPFERVIAIAIQVADALSEAHGKGIVHRDLKPGNILIQDAEGYGEFAKVLDFGLARWVSDGESRLTRTGTVHGTPRYLSPEQILGADVGPRSDLYALGIAMYEALAGRAPFVADVEAALLFKHMKEAPPPLPTDVERATGFDALLERLLAKSPALRPASASALRRELVQMIGSRGAARPTSEPTSGTITTERRALIVLDVSFGLRAGFDASADEVHELARRGHAFVDGVVRRVAITMNGRSAHGAQLVFGAPIARHHDARRALETALELSAGLRAIDVRLDVRIGAADGLAIAGPVRAGEPAAGYLVSGEAVDRAGELRASAAPGEIVVVSTLADRAPATLVIERRGAAALLRGRDAARSHASGTLPFVGRERELEVVRSTLENSRDEGAGSIVLVVGEPGIGKSRLVDRALALAATQGMRSARGAAFDVEVGIGGDALHRIALDLVDVGDDVTDRAAALERRLGPSALRADQWPFLYHYLGVALPGPMQRVYDAMDARTRLAGYRDTIAAIAVHEARAQPIVIAVEDLHWADGPTLDAIDALAAALPRAPITLVLTARSGEDERFRHVLLGHRVTRIDLEPLGEDEATALAARLGITADRQSAVVARAGGHPLLLTELARREGDDDGSLPTDVRGLVQARIDRLAERDRTAIYAAAVLGPVLSRTQLGELLGKVDYAPDALVEERLLRRDEDGMLAFVHALVRDAVYGALVDEHRRDLHLRASVVVGSDLALAAMHLDRGGDPRAPEAYLEVARRDLAIHRYGDAKKHLERGVAIASRLDDRFALIEVLGALELNAFDPAAALEHFRSLASLARDDAETYRAQIGIASALRATSARSGEALEAVSRAEEAASRAGIRSSEVHATRGGVLFATGELEASRAAHERALALAQETGEPEREAQALSGIADAEYGAGHVLAAMRRWEACVDLARRHDLLSVLATNLPMLAMTKVFANEAKDAREMAEQALVLARELSRPRAEALARGAASFAARVCGDADAAEDHARIGIGLAQQLANVAFEQTSRYYRAEALMALGRADDAREELTRALALAREKGHYFIGAAVLGLWARAATASEARAALDEGAELIAKGALSFNRFWFRENAIEAALALGDAPLARAHAEALLGERDLPPWPRIVAERGLLLARVAGGERGSTIDAELAELLERAAAAGLGPMARSIDAALNAAA